MLCSYGGVVLRWCYSASHWQDSLIAKNDMSDFRAMVLAFHLLDHVIDDVTVFKLRAEHDNIRV
jgi:hypothetical protein